MSYGPGDRQVPYRGGTRIRGRNNSIVIVVLLSVFGAGNAAAKDPGPIAWAAATETTPASLAWRAVPTYGTEPPRFELPDPNEDLSPRCDAMGLSESVGWASGGRLVNGCRLPTVPGAAAMFRQGRWGTKETIEVTLAAIAHVRARYPDTADLGIGHLSRRRGGSFPPHRSHQSGRDIDIGYYRTNLQWPPYWRETHRHTLDAPRTWALMSHMIDSGRVQFIFVDYGLQRSLYRQAKKEGVPEERLQEIFQYPRRSATAIIQHSPGHDDHLHVRFHCPETDQRCKG